MGVSLRKMTRLRSMLLACVTAALLILSGCGGEVQPTPQPLTPVPNLILFDTFSPPDPRWATFDTADGAAYALEGEFYVEDRGKGVAVYAPLVGESLRNVAVDVELRQVDGSFDNWAGVICRLQDEANYYFLGISADRYYLILTVKDGVAEALAGPTYSTSILPAPATNRIQVRCQGGALSLMINNQLLIMRTDTSFEEGELALMADAVATGETTAVAFDNLVVYRP